MEPLRTNNAKNPTLALLFLRLAANLLHGNNAINHILTIMMSATIRTETNTGHIARNVLIMNR